jgi:ornithine--oxo-acid transaminase
MSQSEKFLQQIEKYGAHNYHPLPVVLNRGKGSRVWDVDGKEYLDFLACYSALNFGHQHPRLIAACEGQLKKIALCSRAFHSEELCEFSEALAKFCGLDVVLPMNSGAEAVETAIKIARRWGYEKKKIAANRAKILTFENNFHGRTISIVSFSSEEGYKAGFGPFTPGFASVPFGDLTALAAAIDGETAAIIVEPIQAEAGILVPPPGFLAGIRSLCRRHNVLFIADEIQTGMARTGKNFCFEHENAKPDLLVLGKSLGGGLIPVSAVVGRRDVMDVIGPGSHGSTFGGNPLGAAVGREVLRLMLEEKFAAKAEHIGSRILTRLKNEQRAGLTGVKEVRGLGALIGIELDPGLGGARRFCEKLALRGVLCKETHTHVIRLAPPLVMTQPELDEGLDKIVQVIKEG